ncbi:NfeD family protein [Paucidesulfovibrio longus]|uniref:NfeD family protein n=1 Tax=Paucidesulfovibrio longus TaxID=889 RepID=UPI0003B67A67|nr:NfeD family protein [Paucidesulfovibrio longus]
MPDFLTQAYVIWFAIGFCLALAELAAPGFIIIFFGIGCWLTSLASALFDLSLSAQLAIFIVGSLASLIFLRRIFMRVFTGASQESDGDDGLREPGDLGRQVLVTREVRPDLPGEIKYRGSFWRAVSDRSIPEGSAALIVAEFEDDRSTFKIEPLNKGE